MLSISTSGFVGLQVPPLSVIQASFVKLLGVQLSLFAIIVLEITQLCLQIEKISDCKFSILLQHDVFIVHHELRQLGVSSIRRSVFVGCDRNHDALDASARSGSNKNSKVIVSALGFPRPTE